MNGSSRRGSPIGRDGQPLKCHGCGSTVHLHANCPHRRSHQPPTHSAIADYEFTSLQHAQQQQEADTATTTSHADTMQQVIYPGEFGNYLGIVTYLGTGNAVINEETTLPEREVDPL